MRLDFCNIVTILCAYIKHTVCAILKIKLWEFQNGKMGKNSSKIDQDTAKTVEHEILEILKIWKFSLRKTQLLNKNCYFSKFYVLLFLLYLGQFLSYFCSFYHFGILKASSLKWHTVCLIEARNIVTILQKPSLIFFESVSTIFFFRIFYQKEAEK